MAKLPMIGGGFKTQEKYIDKYSIGISIKNDDFESIEKGIISLLNQNYDILKQNCETVFNEFNWNKESNKIVGYYKKILFKGFDIFLKMFSNFNILIFQLQIQHNY